MAISSESGEVTMENNRYQMLHDGGIQLENEEIIAVVYPRYGGKISSFRSRNGEREWFWNNPVLELQAVEYGAPFDDNFYGGMDELFPNDLPTQINGMQLPDHGEFWSQAWDYDLIQEDNRWILRMNMELRNYRVNIERRIYLTLNGMVIENTLTNLSDASFPYMWVLHPAFKIGPMFRFHFPKGKVIVESELNGRVGKGTPVFIWPGTELGMDLSEVPERNGGLESYYITDISDGKFVLEDTESREAMIVEFPLNIFPHMWLFMPLGGWRDHYVAVIEPSSGYPSDLVEAVNNGTHSLLKGKSSMTAIITFSTVSSEDIV